jgi:hypothetical protein
MKRSWRRPKKTVAKSNRWNNSRNQCHSTRYGAGKQKTISGVQIEVKTWESFHRRKSEQEKTKIKLLCAPTNTRTRTRTGAKARPTEKSKRPARECLNCERRGDEDRETRASHESKTGVALSAEQHPWPWKSKANCLCCFVDLASDRLGWTFEQKLFFRPLLGRYLTGVLLTSQMVDVNDGIQLLEAIRLQQERKK